MTKKKKIKKPNKSLNIQNIIPNKKLQYALIVTVIIFILLIIRLFTLQVVQGEYLSNLAITQQTTSEVISSKRRKYI